MPRPDLDAQASSMKSSAVTRRRKDAGRRRQHLKRKKARRVQNLRTGLIAGGAALALVAVLFLLHHLASGSGEAEFPPEAYRQSGVFICENCDYPWDWEVRLSHPYDPYVECPRCHLRKARKALQCPHCEAWVLVELPEPPVPFDLMEKGDKRHWDLKVNQIIRRARCPECRLRLWPSGAPAAP